MSSSIDVFNLDLNLKICSFLSTILKKSFFGGCGINFLQYPLVSSSSPNPLYGGNSGSTDKSLNFNLKSYYTSFRHWIHWKLLRKSKHSLEIVNIEFPGCYIYSQNREGFSIHKQIHCRLIHSKLKIEIKYIKVFVFINFFC